MISNQNIIKYWPNQPSIKLNHAVVDLFIETERKLILRTKNKSNEYLYLDILNIITKTELLQTILSELKELILDIIEINLNSKTIVKLNRKIQKIFINRVSKKFFFKFRYSETKLNTIENLNENNLADYLLTYLIFGSSYIEEKIFLFETLYTPYNHVRVLLENFIIQIANTITKRLIYSLNETANIHQFLRKQNISNKLYTSSRTIVLFLNNLKWQNFIKSQIYDIKSLYSERQKVLIFSTEGIITKNIYMSNNNKIKRVNNISLIFLFWLEIKDLLIPKTEKLVIQIAKYLLYCLINLLSNSILILIRILVFYLNK
uniref:Uncharacterized protein n=1 Tax=Dipterosiphonia australica TaxID=2007208 RepID=A0A1Z1MKX8_9FLOR|nr:hypothetical protein [Dipterosiphonia australica]ARW66747.1 hypothetical protein [Dipterosiphonia australica]